MKYLLFVCFVFLGINSTFCQQVQGCPEFPRWQKLMDKGNFEEATNLAELVLNYEEPWSWKPQKDINTYRDFQKKYSINTSKLCRRYFLAEPARRQGNLSRAVNLATNWFNALNAQYRNDKFGYDYKNNEPAMLDKYVHWCMELGEKELAAGNLEEALTAFNWGVNVGNFDMGVCAGYPMEKNSVSHAYILTELVGDVYFKKDNYKQALKLYQLFDSSKYSKQISSKIVLTKSKIASLQSRLIEKSNQAKLQYKQDEATLPILFKQTQKRTVGLLASGNISTKINAAKEPISPTINRKWENNDLVFSASGEELYFKNYVDSNYQFWDVKSQKKLGEIPFSEMEKTQKGREILSSFVPLYIFSLPPNATFSRWISDSLQLSIEKLEHYTISNEKGEPIYSFSMPTVLSSGAIETIRIQLYYHKALNKLFIYKLEKNLTKDYESSMGIYVYNLNTKQIQSVFRKYTYNPDKNSWRFSNNFIILNKLTESIDFWTNGISLYDLELVNKEVLSYDYQYDNHLSGEINNSNLYLCSDNQNHHYFLDTSNKGNTIKIKYAEAKSLEVVTILPSRKLNSLTIDPTGKHIAYFETFFLPNTGNFVSINMYNINEPDKLYTLTDQTKYPMLLAKNYVTSKENGEYLFKKAAEDALALNKKQIADRLESENAKQQAADELAKKALAAREAQNAKDKKIASNRQLYKQEFDSLSLEFTKVENKIQAIRQKEMALFNQKKYAELLAMRHWELTVQFPMSLKDENHNMAFLTNFTLKLEMSFLLRGDNETLDLKIKSTFTVPSSQSNNRSSLWFDDKYTSSVSSTRDYIVAKFKGTMVRMEQFYPGISKPLPKMPFGDDSLWVNSVRNEFCFKNELYIYKKSFGLNVVKGTLPVLTLYDEDGTGDCYAIPTKEENELYEKKNTILGRIRIIDERK
ncbi:MAG: cell envelope integrity protein TolA [Bacteroidetes bacterium]|nr:cell envelope integrity protein TolA [Bacteroidota bacterium]